MQQQTPPEAAPIIPNPNRTWNGAPPSRFNPLIMPPEDRLNVRAAVTELARLRKIRRLHDDLGLNAAGVEVALRLLDEIENLRITRNSRD